MPLLRVQQIIEVNGVLRQGLVMGLPITSLMENWDFMQVPCKCNSMGHYTSLRCTHVLHLASVVMPHFPLLNSIILYYHSP